MNKAKHTPGPLTAGDIEYGTILQGNFVLYRLNPGVPYEKLNEESKQRLLADATLYAAAPDMLKTLKKAQTLLRLLTVRQVIEAGWDEIAAAAGLNPYCLNEGLASGDEKIRADFVDWVIREAEGRA